MTRAVILAAGRGSRMRMLTEERPKCLVEYRGRPLLAWQLAALRGAGVEEIALVTGYRREMLARFVSREFHNPRWEKTNMVSSLACADEWLGQGDCIVSYSDIVYGVDAVEAVLACPGDLAVAYGTQWLAQWEARFGDPLADAETFRIGEDSRIREIGGKPSSVEEIQGQYMGLLRFRPAAWAAMREMRSGLDPERRDRLDMTGALQLLIQGGFPVHGAAVSSAWGEFDSAEDLRRLAGLEM